MTRSDFIVGAANAEAASLIDAWPHWPTPAMVLAGPTGAGKTHLATIWIERAGGVLTRAASLEAAAVDRIAGSGAVAVEDIHQAPLDEQALFHLLNLTRERGVPVLLTTRVWPVAIPIRLPDLRSRLRAATLVELREPDDDLLRRVLIKLFTDRQIAVDDAVVEYIAVRMERSLAGANLIVDDLDRTALAAGGPITRRLAGLSLARVFDRQPDLFAE